LSKAKGGQEVAPRYSEGDDPPNTQQAAAKVGYIVTVLDLVLFLLTGRAGVAVGSAGRQARIPGRHQ
jgi:hypothetical protein